MLKLSEISSAKLAFWANYAILPLVALVLSIIFTALLVKILPCFGMVDKVTGGRHIHTREVPRGGGLAIICACLVTGLAVQFLDFDIWTPYREVNIFKSLLPIGILAITGIVDDSYGLPPKVKLLLQIFAAAICWYGGIRLEMLFGWHLPVWLGCVATIFWLVGIINAFNLIDGIDGLAAGVCSISAICLGGILIYLNSPGWAMALLCLAGACIGFLRFNFYPAKIFLGDTGSMFLGFVIGAIGIETNTKLATLPAMIVPILACGIPILDTTMAIWRRVTNRLMYSGDENGSVMQGDRNHLHHRMLEHFHNSQPQTVVFIYFLAIVLCVVGVISIFLPERRPWLVFFIAVCAFGVLVQRIAIIELWNSNQLFYGKFDRRKVGVFLNIFHWFFDFAVLLVGFYVICPQNVGNLRELLIYELYCVPTVLLVLSVSRCYRSYWLHAVIDDFFNLFIWIFLGIFVSYLLVAIIGRYDMPMRNFLQVWCMASSVIVCERMFLTYLKHAIVRIYNKSTIGHEGCRSVPTMLYGVNVTSRNYIHSYYGHFGKDGVEEILVGYIDDDRRYRYGYCNGLKVWGDVDSLELIHSQTPFEKLVICRQNPNPEKFAKLLEFCKARNIEVVKFSFVEERVQ